LVVSKAASKVVPSAALMVASTVVLWVVSRAVPSVVLKAASRAGPLAVASAASSVVSRVVSRAVM